MPFRPPGARMRTLPSPSPYLQSTIARWKDRNALIRRDVEIMLEGLKLKGLLLGDLRQRVRQHRQEDIAQLKEARRESWVRWEERIKRLEKWMVKGATLKNATANLVAWRQSALGFDRARELGQKYAQALAHKAFKIEKKLSELSERMKQWSVRLRAMEVDLREFAERHADKAAEVLVSKARKQPYLDFVFAERDEEGRMTLDFKSIRATANRALERIARADQWVADRAAANPEHFEARKSSLLETWRPFHKRISELREAILHQAVDFEEGRKRLRWIYDQVQRMRVVQDAIPARRPLLERLFRPKE
jgi:hypothetical protein